MSGATAIVARTFLFVPASREDFINKAVSIAPDVVIVDLEASIPADQKVEARHGLADRVRRLKLANITVYVRVNRDVMEDYRAAWEAGADAIVVPCVEDSQTLAIAAEYISASADVRAVAWLPIIETPRGLLNAQAIINTAVNVTGVFFGAEDFVLRLGGGVEPTETALLNAAWQISVIASASGIPCYGIAGSLADYQQLEVFRRLCEQAKALGMAGCPAIHPKQVAIVKEVFQPRSDELIQARAIVELFETAGHRVVSYNGKMIDFPVYERAKKCLQSVAGSHH